MRYPGELAMEERMRPAAISHSESLRETFAAYICSIFIPKNRKVVSNIIDSLTMTGIDRAEHRTLGRCLPQQAI